MHHTNYSTKILAIDSCMQLRRVVYEAGHQQVLVIGLSNDDGLSKFLLGHACQHISNTANKPELNCAATLPCGNQVLLAF